VICDGQGIPLAVTLTAGNRNDITELIGLVDRVPPTGRYGKFRPKTLLADRAYDSRKHRQELKERGIKPRIAKRGTGHGSGLG
jgi:transposase